MCYKDLEVAVSGMGLEMDRAERKNHALSSSPASVDVLHVAWSGTTLGQGAWELCVL